MWLSFIPYWQDLNTHTHTHIRIHIREYVESSIIICIQWQKASLKTKTFPFFFFFCLKKFLYLELTTWYGEYNFYLYFPFSPTRKKKERKVTNLRVVHSISLKLARTQLLHINVREDGERKREGSFSVFYLFIYLFIYW